MTLHDTVRSFENGAQHLTEELTSKIKAEEAELSAGISKLYNRFLDELRRVAHVIHPPQPSQTGEDQNPNQPGTVLGTAGQLGAEAGTAASGQSAAGATSAAPDVASNQLSNQDPAPPTDGAGNAQGTTTSATLVKEPVQPIEPTVQPNQEPQTPVVQTVGAG